MPSAIPIAPGVLLWREYFPPPAQQALLDAVLAALKQAPLYRPAMLKSGRPFSVEQSNFGALGWASDRHGYRYQPLHPATATPWPAIPQALLTLWDAIAHAPPPDC